MSAAGHVIVATYASLVVVALSGCYLSHQREVDGMVDAGARPDSGPRDGGRVADASVACVAGEILARDYVQHFDQLVGAAADDGLWLIGSPGPVRDEPAPMQLLRTTPVAGSAPEVALEAEIPGSEGFQAVETATFGSRIAILAGHPSGRVTVFLYDRATGEVATLAVPEGAATPTYGGVALLADRVAVTSSSSDPDRFPYIVTTAELAPIATGELLIASTVGVRDGRLVAASYTRESSRLHLRLFAWSDATAEFSELEDIGLGLSIGRWGEDAYVAYGGASIVLLTSSGREDLPPVPRVTSFQDLPSIARAGERYFVALSTSAGLFIGIRALDGWTWTDLRTAGGQTVAFARGTSRGAFALSFNLATGEFRRLLYRGLCDAR